MNRVNEIIQNSIFKAELNRIEQLEQTRIYCCHGLDHLLDVARCTYILNLERNTGYKKDVIYAAALLHDIGRAEQYSSGVNHRDAGLSIAQRVLCDTSFSEEERAVITDCIKSHGDNVKDDNSLISLISISDHRTRMCFNCKAADTCKWTDEERNMTIEM